MSERSFSPEERARFDAEGYLVRESALSQAQCDALSARLSRLIVRVAEEHRDGKRTELDFWKMLPASAHGLAVFWDVSRGSLSGLPVTEWETRAMRIGHALHLVDDRFRAAALSPAVAGRLGELVPGPARIIQSAVIYKQPHSELVQFGYHQDSAYLPTEPESLALAFIALDDMDAENGCLEVVPGSHRRGLGVRLRLGPSGYVPASGHEARFAPGSGRLLPVPKGAVIYVHGNTYHASAPNRSPRPRRAYIVHALGAGSKLHPEAWIQEPPEGFIHRPKSKS